MYSIHNDSLKREKDTIVPSEKLEHEKLLAHVLNNKQIIL